MLSYNIKDNDDGIGVGDNSTLPNFHGQRLSHYSHLNVDTGITANQSAITWQIEIVSQHIRHFGLRWYTHCCFLTSPLDSKGYNEL